MVINREWACNGGRRIPISGCSGRPAPMIWGAGGCVSPSVPGFAGLRPRFLRCVYSTGLAWRAIAQLPDLRRL